MFPYSFFFSIAVFVYLLFVCPHFSSLSFVLELIILFILLLYLIFSSSPYCFCPKKSKISVVNFSWWNSVFVFWTLPSSVFHLLFFPPCVVLIPYLFHVLLIISASWHYYSWFSSINLLFGSLKKISRFVFDQKFQKISLILFLTYFWKKKKRFYWVSSFCAFYFFMHDLQKHVAILCFQSLFGKISCFLCRSPFVSVRKKFTSKKKRDSLYFSLLLFLLNLFSLNCVISSCLLSLLIVFSFSTIFLFSFLPSFSFHVSLSLCLPSHYVYLLSLSLSLSLSLMLLLFIPSKKITFIFFLKNFFHLFIHSCKTVFVLSPLLLRSFFSHLFLQSCSFEQEKLTLFFFWKKNNLFNPSKNFFFSEILSFDDFF